MPAVAEPFTATGMALPVAVTVAVAVAQFAGVLRSHSR